MKTRIFFVGLLIFLYSELLAQKKINLAVSYCIGTVDKMIDIPDNAEELVYFSGYIENRFIEESKAVNLALSFFVSEDIQLGGEVMVGSLILDNYFSPNTQPNYITGNTLPLISFGLYTKHQLKIFKNFYADFLTSGGLIMNYPKEMLASEILKEGVAGYLDLAVGPKYQITKAISLGYLFGYGRVNHRFELAYTFE